MGTPTTDKFLGEIGQILRFKDGTKLQDYLLIEPPLPPLYTVIVQELKRQYPKTAHDLLDKKCAIALPEYEDGSAAGGSWTAFITFLVQYFGFIRDINPQQLVETHDMLKSLLNQCILALSDASMGIVVLPTVVSYSRVLARLSIGLDKRPELVASLTNRQSSAGTEDAFERVTLVESSANVIREGFKKCLSERSGDIRTGLTANNKPEGRRTGIYLCANICLKLFFHCKKLRSAEQIFGNIYQQSPPLACFPASQRVTYLYYLGRYQFANNHFHRAQLALQGAYDQCHPQSPSQRHRILTYLIASNIILGRFPSSTLLSRPEAKGLSEYFLPLCFAIRNGDLKSFNSHLSLSSPHASWYLRRRILFQLQNRGEVLIWRSLSRKVFLLTGFKGEDNSKRAPTLDLHDLHIALKSLAETDPYIDPDIEGYTSDGESYTCIPNDDNPEDNLGFNETEAAIASLINQNLIQGYISHKHAKFVITGAKTKGALAAGFPPIWEALKKGLNDAVPGWVRREKGVAFGGSLRAASGGMVVSLSGARAVGVADA